MSLKNSPRYLLLCAALCCAARLSAADWYVAPSGNNANAGNMANPFLTIAHAVTTASNGDNIYVEPGTYNENVTVNKSLTLLSTGGRAVTVITGSTGLGAILIQANNVTIGGPGQGFTINGYDSANPGLEYAAVYVQGVRSNVTIRGNEVVANGEAGLLTEFGQSVSNLVVNANIFSGQTFTGVEAGDCGFGNQFTAANVPRQLVAIPTGSGVTFTSNSITGTAGSASTVSGCTSLGQGNTLVTIDANNATISGNTFAGTTTRFGHSLRARGTGASIYCNTFDNTGLGLGCVHIFFNATSLGALGTPNSLAGVAAANTFLSEGAYFTGATQIYRSSAQVSAIPQTPIAANSAPLATVTNTNTGLSYCSIQDAVSDVNTLNGHTITVAAGTYAENLTINKSLDLRGPNYGISPNTGTRVGEATITGGINLDNTASKTVSVTGFQFTGVTSPLNYNGNAGGTVAATITFRENIVSSSSGQLAILLGTATNTASATIDDNSFLNMTANAMQLAAGAGTLDASITDNTINTTVNAGMNTDGLTNSTISGNTISNTTQQGIQIAGPAANVTVSNNVITNANTSNGADRGGIRLYGTAFTGQVTLSNNAISGSNNGIAIRNSENITGKMITVTNNSLSGNVKTIYHGGTGALSAECNWFGVTNSTAIAATLAGTGAAAVDFSPFLFTGVDSAPMTIGFQPADPCSGPDVVPPTAVCQNATVVLDENGNATLAASLVNDGSSDNVTLPANLVFAVSPNTFVCADEGDQSVTLTVTDEEGNTANCMATVTVLDVLYYSETPGLRTAISGLAQDKLGWGLDLEGGVAIGGAPDDKVGTQNKQGSAFVYLQNQGGSNNWGALKQIKASDGLAVEYFGNAVSIDGSTAIVGAYGDNLGALTDCGSAFIFEQNFGGSNNWGERKRVSASDASSYAYFANAVSLENGRAIVGASKHKEGAANARGAVYIFEKDSGSADNWGQTQKLLASDGAANNFFGASVGQAGNIALVGANGNLSNRGAVYVFDGNAAWAQTQKLTASDAAVGDGFGTSLAMSSGYAIIGTPNKATYTGAAYVFKNNAGTWSELKKLTASDGATNDRFGTAVDLEGDYAYISALRANGTAGAVYVFHRNAGGPDNWGQIGKYFAAAGAANDQFGYSVAASGDMLAVGANLCDLTGPTRVDAGAVYFFTGEDCPDVPKAPQATLAESRGLAETLSVKCSPNPFRDELAIEINATGAARLTVTDAAGRMMTNLELPAGLGRFTLETSAFRDGMYFVQVSSESGVRVVPVALVR